MAKDKIIEGKRKRTRRKRTCCERCRRKICRWFYRRIKRCCKKAIFGVPDPRLSDYEIAGINLANLKGNKSAIKDTRGKRKKSVSVLYKNKNHSTISIPLKEKLKRENAVKNPSGRYIKAVLSDLKENNLYVGLSKDSKLGLTNSTRDKFSQMAKEYEEKYKKKSILDGLAKYNSSFLKKYEGTYKPLSDLKVFGNISKDKLKKKLSITSSNYDVLKNMRNDYDKKKLSLTGLFSKSKQNLDQLDKEEVKEIIGKYKKKKKNYTFVKQSKIKQFKSDLRAKLSGIG